MGSFKNSADFEAIVFKAQEDIKTTHSYITAHMLPHEHPYHSGDQISEQLTMSNFGSFVRQNEMIIVNYYAPWCIWCQRLSPTW